MAAAETTPGSRLECSLTPRLRSGSAGGAVAPAYRGTPLNRTGISEVMPRLWRRLGAERGGPAREIQARAEALEFTAPPERAKIRLARLLPYVRSNQTSAPSAGSGKSPRSRPCPQQRTGPKPCSRCSAGTSLPISGCLAPSRRGNTALRGQASAHAPEQPVLDVRNQPDNHRRRRTERRLLSGTFAVVVMLAAGRWRRRGIAGLADAPPAAAGCRCSRVGDQARATWTLAGSSLPPR